MSELLPLFKAASYITTKWSLAASAMALLVYLAVRRQKGALRISGNVAVLALVLLALVPPLMNGPAVYQVRVIVLDTKGTPVEDAKVWSSFGGEPKKVAGGWQFDIPNETVPADRKLKVYATLPAAFLSGEREALLGDDHHPGVTIELVRVETSIRGIVTDDRGRAVEGAEVTVVGYGSEQYKTRADGSFELPAHAADGQQVQLHAQKPGLKPAEGWFPAGDAPVTLELRH
jgi:hypothetical protein